MNSIVTIREAKIDDASRLVPLFEQLGYPQPKDIIENRLDAYIKTPDHNVFATEKEGMIVGFIALVGADWFIEIDKVYRIVALIIDESYRGQGIGKLLIQQAEDFAKSHGGGMIELTSGLRRAESGSHKFYDSLGYKNEGVYAKLFLRKALK